MPELPEVETVRDGLERHVLDAVVTQVEVFRASAVRRQVEGPEGFRARLLGRALTAAVRRGKFLWLLLDGEEGPGGDVLLTHLGMSGQLLVRGPDDLLPPHPHLRARLHLTGSQGQVRLDFVDQRTFGALVVTDLVGTRDGAPGGHGSALPALPAPVVHIARDLLDPAADRAALVAALRLRRVGVKRAILDQTLVSGLGNIYADEALWRARLHGERSAQTLRATDARRVLDAGEEVMREALAAGGTSFDALYVNVNGASGYFSRSLAVYGQEGRPCPRCAVPVRREAFMNRSSFSCPRCQPRPRTARRAPSTPGGL